MSLAEARSRIQASLARRPQTAAQLSSALLAEPSLVERALSELLSQGLAEEVRRDAVEKGVNAADVYYQARG